MLVFCKPVSLKLGIINKPCYYMENMYGGDLVKVQIKNLDPRLINVISTNMKAMFLWFFFFIEKDV